MEGVTVPAFHYREPHLDIWKPAIITTLPTDTIAQHIVAYAEKSGGRARIQGMLYGANGAYGQELGCRLADAERVGGSVTTTLDGGFRLSFKKRHFVMEVPENGAQEVIGALRMPPGAFVALYAPARTASQARLVATLAAPALSTLLTDYAALESARTPVFGSSFVNM